MKINVVNPRYHLPCAFGDDCSHLLIMTLLLIHDWLGKKKLDLMSWPHWNLVRGNYPNIAIVYLVSGYNYSELWFFCDLPSCLYHKHRMVVSCCFQKLPMLSCVFDLDPQFQTCQTTTGGFIFLYFYFIYGIILPFDFHIFQDGYCITN
jgi:hypothetical protein